MSDMLDRLFGPEDQPHYDTQQPEYDGAITVTDPNEDGQGDGYWVYDGDDPQSMTRRWYSRNKEQQ